MKIAHVIDSMEVGGAERLTLDLCRMQKRQGHSVSVHCLFLGGPLVPSLEEAGVSVFVHRDSPGVSEDCGMRAKARFIGRLRRHFSQESPDAVHCHNAFATIVGAPAARLAGVQSVVSTRHGLNLHPHNLHQEIPYWLAVRCGARVAAVCRTGEKNLADNPLAVRHRLTTVQNGAWPAECSRAVPELPVARHKFQMITVARLKPPKDHATLLRALAIAARAIDDPGLWIVGDGSSATMLQGLAAELGIEDWVHFAGELQAIGDWLTHSDLFVLSSLSEGVPISLLEAMAAGLPALVTSVGGMAEVVGFSGAGRLVPPGDASLMACAIRDLAGNREVLAEWGRRARQVYLQHFTFERMAEQYMNLYCAPFKREGTSARQYPDSPCNSGVIDSQVIR